MVHNGIEYGDMQLISEVYDVLKVRTKQRLHIAAVADEFTQYLFAFVCVEYLLHEQRRNGQLI